MRCETCDRFPAIAYVRIEKVEEGQKTEWLGQGYVCRGCLRRVCRAMQLDFPLPEAEVPNLFEDETAEG